MPPVIPNADGLTRRPTFWVAYAALAAVSLVIAWRLFPLALPLINLDIKLSRQEALANAEALDQKFQLSPAGSRKAVRFTHDQSTQNYVELEGGGKAAFAALVAGDVYSPYRWEVRLFNPGEVTEALVRFRPDGSTYGFRQTRGETFVPSDPTRRALDAETARRIAEDTARADWNVDLGAYKAIEQTQQQRTTGRVDHVFVYERLAGNLGESRFRLRLGVTGDALSEVTYFVHIPESFQRRFVELRSANNTIASAASLAAGLLYGLGGCILGVLWLLRRHGLLWRPALVAGFVVGGLMGMAQLANASSALFGFDTAQSVATFWARQAGTAVLIAFGGGMFYALAFMAAEGLSRSAFGQHPQLWRVWSRDAAPSREVLGRTLGGYLFIPIELALIAAFYYATNRWLGWWQPSESLTDPNVLGSLVPALMPIAVSLQAGLMEECVFRAIPLSLAAIIGERYGKRRLAIGIAVVLQALIFGGAHANYPGFPAYSRLVELVLPSIAWALIFLRFGLLPTVILHALFDLVLFSIPVFLVDAPGGNLQRAIIIAAGLVPLAIVLARRATSGKWQDLATTLRNGAWQPGMRPVAQSIAPEATASSGWIAVVQRWLPALGLAGFIAWLVFTPFHADVPPLKLDRAQAEAAADAALKMRGVTLGPEWRRFAVPKLATDEPTQWSWHEFVWREAGPETYGKLIGNTLAPPLWDVRYARFEGDIAERAEEWRLTINPDGTPRVVRHTLPETRAGASLDRDAARTLAENEVRATLDLEPSQLRQVGAEETRRPARADWTFTFADPRIALGKDGEARVLVSLAGDEITTAGRFVHVPEEWQRVQRERDGRLGIVKLLLGALVALMMLAAIVMAVLEWNRGHIDRRASIAIALITFSAAIVGIADRWPRFAINLNTAQPIASQIALAVLGSLFAGLLAALLSGLLAGVGSWAAQRQMASVPTGRRRSFVAGAMAALLAAGVSAAVDTIGPRTDPLWTSYAIEGAWWPPIAATLQGLQVLVSASIIVYLFYCLDRMTARYTRGRWLALIFIVLGYTGAALASGDGLSASVGGAVEGLVVFVLIYAMLRFDYRMIPAFVATGVCLQAIETAAQKASVDAWIYAALTIAGALFAAWMLGVYMEDSRAGERSAA